MKSVSIHKTAHAKRTIRPHARRAARAAHGAAKAVGRGSIRAAAGAGHGFLAPFRALRWRYVPLLTIQFAAGAAGFSGIAETFFVKDKLVLTAQALIALAVWLQIPWNLKIVVGQLVDAVPILASRRRSYTLVGAGLIAASYVILAGLAGDHAWAQFGSPEALYALASFLSVIGLVVQSVVADAMSSEVVARADAKGRARPKADINADLGMVQVLARLAFSSGAFAVAGLGGWLAQILSYETMFLLALFIPALSVAGTLFVRLEVGERRPIDWRLLGGGLVFGAVCAAVAIAGLPFAQEVVFAVSLGALLYFSHVALADVDVKLRRAIAYATFLVFVFRAMPSFGPGAQWWQIDVLGFDPAFFGTLGQWSAAIAIIGTWLFSHAINHQPLPRVLLWLTIIGPALALPSVAMYYGLHEWTALHFGFGARAIAIVDVSISSPFLQLAAIPMMTLTAVYAPPGRRGTWFGLMGSLMNLAVQASGLFTKYLNTTFVVDRGDYENLGALMIIATVLSLVLPLAVLWFISTRIKLGAAAGDRAAA